jgi:osmoprotectant transport system ATP-binding protein
MPIPLIDVDRVSKSFDGGRTFAVEDVSLAVEAGAFVCVVGGSGSGKTTTLKTINRLIEPDRGEVRVEGRPVGTIPGPQLRRRIGYVFQDLGLFPHMTVAENIGITPQLLRWPAADIAARTAELLVLVELPRHFASRLPQALSGGQRQRVAVARAIAARPKILLMDEPFGALDPVTRDALSSAFRALHDRLGLTTIMVTHDVQEAVLLADRIIVMREGRILADDTPGRLLATQSNCDVAALMSVPKRQAERVRAIMEQGAAAGGRV